MIRKELKGFNINIDDVEPNELTHGAMQELEQGSGSND